MSTLLPNKKLVMMYIPNGILRPLLFPGEENAVLPGFVGGFNADKLKNDKRILNKPESTRFSLLPRCDLWKSTRKT